jgi:hypothetical protein
MRYSPHVLLSDSQLRTVKATLANDENATDAEMIEYFVREVGIPEDVAKKFVARRTAYLNGEC